jgi:hypothetical protein
MPAFKFPSPILYIASEPSFFALLDGSTKSLSLKDVTRIDFPLIEKGHIHKDNLVHTLKSLEQKSLHLVLSDEIFYHHISDYTLTGKKGIEDEIKETVATVFADKKEPLHIVTVDLAKTSKMQTVQITAMTKTNLSKLAQAAKEAGVKIESIIPASFVVKAFVSVDPSLFLLATPHSFLLTSHYIGVDFAQNLDKDSTKELIKTVKTLKKERPHIQHIYICADDTDSTLNEDLAEVMPIQDVEVQSIDSENDTPFFLKALTLGVKEVIENDFPLPQFSVENAEVLSANEEEDVDVSESETIEPIAEVLKIVKEEEEAKDDDKEIEKVEKIAQVLVDDEIDEIAEPEKEVETAVENVVEKKVSKKDDDELPEVELEDIPAPAIAAEPKAIEAATASSATTVASVAAPKVVAPPKEVSADVEVEETVEEKTVETKTVETPKKVITIGRSTETTSSSSRASRANVKPAKKMGIFNYVLLAFGVALVISLVGGGIVISQQAISDKDTGTLQTPISSVTPEPDEEEEPTPTPKPTAAPVALDELDILVVNATSIAGKAGKVATAIKKTDANLVDTGNAKDDYEDEGTFIMFAKPEFSGVKEELEEATGLTFEEIDMSKTENTGGKYDIVIVLNE